MSQLLPAIERIRTAPGQDPDAAIIWLHGLGADGHDFEPIAPQLRLPEALALRFIFPHAPVRPVSVNMGMSMRSWYDIIAMSDVREIDAEQLQQSCEQLEALIARQIEAGIPPERILLAGFSQGGAVALTTALRYPRRLAGVLALSTYLPKPEWIEQGASVANHGAPIFLAHGLVDNVVPLKLAQSAHGLLQRLGYQVEWHQYPMPHAVCAEEIEHIGRWLTERLPVREA